MIDLHLHSTYSDGKLKPVEVAKKLVAARVKIASLTDHDTIDGTLKFNKALKKFGIIPINGVEITAYQDKIGLHILGLGIDIKNKLLLKIFARQAKERKRSFIKTIKLFEKARFIINQNKLSRLKKLKILSKPHIFDLIFSSSKNRELLESKFGFSSHFVPNRLPQSIFIDMFMSLPGQIAFVEKGGISCREAIKAIHKAGGLVVLAHPGIEIEFGKNKGKILKMIKKLIKFGIDGIESFSVALAKRKKISYFHKIAKKYKLIETVGSDDHDGSRIGTVKINQTIKKQLIKIFENKKHLAVL
ncbi:MAG: PHP domain-containing protein [Patescibacteria group bacterium]